MTSKMPGANYKSIEAYLPEQVVDDGILRIEFRKFLEKVDGSKKIISKEISGHKILLIGLGLVCCL